MDWKKMDKCMQKKKKVLVSVYAISPGGGPHGYTYNLFSSIRNLKGEERNCIELIPSVEISQVRTNNTDIIIPNFKKRIISVAKGLFAIWLIRLFAPFAFIFPKFGNYDLIVMQGFHSPMDALKYLIRAKCIYMPHSPTPVAQEMELNYSSKGKHLSRIEYLLYICAEYALFRAATAIVFPSRGAMDSYIEPFRAALRKEKIHYIRSTVPDVSTAKDAEKNEKGKFILFAGRYIEHKGFDLYCRAADVLKKETPEIQCVSIGGGGLPASLGIKDLGWQKSPDKFIADARAIVIPNRVAYYDLLPIECAAMGKPLIMSKIGGNADQLLEFPDSIAFKPDDVRSLVEAIQKAWRYGDDPMWGKRNQEAYKKRFSSHLFAKEWISLMGHVIANGNR